MDAEFPHSKEFLNAREARRYAILPAENRMRATHSPSLFVTGWMVRRETR
jgi:hypothetical protein